MTTTDAPGRARPDAKKLLNKVPEVTLYFWVIKILCTTVGETAADFLNVNLSFGLTNTSYAVGALLAVVLACQVKARRYIPALYWSAVVLVSVVGTLITDNLTDNAGVPLQTTTMVFAGCLAATFAAWFASERTLSIHSITTRRREGFYWLTILFTFALGTAAGDLVAEKMALGYGPSVAIFAAVIALITLAHHKFNLGAITAFWAAYILTRPLGASIGDLMSQPTANGGWGLGTTGTSPIFLATILGLVAFLTVTKKDRIETVDADERNPITA